MRAIVHIGMPKVGSTAIQSWLGLNATALAQQGIAYDPANLPGYPENAAQQGVVICQNFHIGRLPTNPALKVAYGLHSKNDLKAFAENFESYFGKLVASRDEDVFVISCEYIGAGSRRRRHTEVMHAWLSRYFDDIRYVVYFRRQEDWIASSYSERLKRGIAKTLDEVIEESGEQDWAKVARIWARAAGRRNVNVRLLEPDFLLGGDLIRDFASAIGADYEGLTPPDKRNEALSAAAAELLRIANHEIPHTVANGRKINPDKVALRRALIEYGADYPRISLTSEQIARIREINHDSNERLRARWFPKRAELFAEKPHRGQDSDHTANVADLAARLLSKQPNLAAAELLRRVASN